MIYCGEVVLQKGSPARELEPTVTYRLGVFMRWVGKPQEVLWVGQVILNIPLILPRSWLEAGHSF
jgi:hypothetical protein